MYLYCLDCDVKVTIMWIKFEKKREEHHLEVCGALQLRKCYVSRLQWR